MAFSFIAKTIFVSEGTITALQSDQISLYLSGTSSSICNLLGDFAFSTVSAAAINTISLL